MGRFAPALSAPYRPAAPAYLSSLDAEDLAELRTLIFERQIGARNLAAIISGIEDFEATDGWAAVLIQSIKGAS